MRFLILTIALLTSPTMAQDCGPGGDDLVTTGETNARNAQGVPYATIRAVGGVTIRRRVQPGYGDGSFTYTTRCDPEEAARMRGLDRQPQAPVEEHAAVDHIPDWLLERH